MIRQIAKSDYLSLKHLWKSAFHDDDQYIDDFLHHYPGYTGLIREIRKQIVSMLFMIPCRIENRNGYYLYACATLPGFQGKGYMAKLLEHAFEKVQREKGFGLILIPGEKELFHYYRRLSYQSFSGLEENVFSTTKGEKTTFQIKSTACPEQIVQVRNKFYGSVTFVAFEGIHIAFIQKQLMQQAGGILFFSENEKSGYVFYIRHANAPITILEWALISENIHEDLPDFFDGVCCFLKTEKILVRSRTGLKSGVEHAFSMIRPCNDFVLPECSTTYFNLGMDL